MKTTATAAMETLLNVPPLDLIIQARAFATADRLVQNGLWTSNFQAGHGKIRGVVDSPVFGMPRDRMTPVTDFTKRFDATFLGRVDWLNGWPTGLSRGSKVRFTDGSKTPNGTGAGVYAPETGLGNSFYLGEIASVPQAELYAALMGAHEALPIGTQGEEVLICLDNIGMIKALVSPVVTSKLVKECKEYLNLLGLSNRINLVWVPGHSGVEGNEEADKLGKEGSAAQANGPEPYLPIPQSECKRALEDWIKRKHAERWEAYDGGVHTKCFFPKPNEKWAKDLLKMDRNRIRRVVGAITGHCGLNRHMNKLRLSDTPRCSCDLEEETGAHLICDCPKFLQLRRRMLGDYEVVPSEIAATGPDILDRFLSATGRLP